MLVGSSYRISANGHVLCYEKWYDHVFWYNDELITKNSKSTRPFFVYHPKDRKRRVDSIKFLTNSPCARTRQIRKTATKYFMTSVLVVRCGSGVASNCLYIRSIFRLNTEPNHLQSYLHALYSHEVIVNRVYVWQESKQHLCNEANSSTARLG